ncbi:MAG: tyrosine-type recombinase/integrase [Oligoflexales bacterium]
MDNIFVRTHLKIFFFRSGIHADSALVDVFNHLKERLEIKRFQHNPVFLNSRGKLLKDNTVRKNFDAAFQACGLQWSGTHIARHTFATLALMSNSTLSEVQAVLGHKHQSITEGYAKVAALQDSPVSAQVAAKAGISKAKDSNQHHDL